MLIHLYSYRGYARSNIEGRVVVLHRQDNTYMYKKTNPYVVCHFSKYIYGE
jgi:hypothetical protein